MNHLPHKRRECRECGRPLHDGERLLCVGCSVESRPTPETEPIELFEPWVEKRR
jgi:NMD protein affecting ribosome stability and mRNA decay